VPRLIFAFSTFKRLAFYLDFDELKRCGYGSFLRNGGKLNSMDILIVKALIA
jgi:hypothetical protein